ncbi:hypothetical protein KJ865_02835, partial [Myxococcota bacterium]|nr:hypothetical protein [Myxococcota bacterium]
MEIPHLYHLTNELYVQSIIEKGLGGFNPNLEYGVLEFFRHLYEIVVDCKIEESLFPRPFAAYERIYNQERGYINFSHATTYFSAQLFPAIQYASNVFSSELLSFVIELYDIIVGACYETKVDTSLFRLDIRVVKKFENKHVMVKVEDVSL